MDSLGALLNGDMDALNEFLSSDDDEEGETEGATSVTNKDMEEYYAALDYELKDTKVWTL